MISHWLCVSGEESYRVVIPVAIFSSINFLQLHVNSLRRFFFLRIVCNPLYLGAFGGSPCAAFVAPLSWSIRCQPALSCLLTFSFAECVRFNRHFKSHLASWLGHSTLTVLLMEKARKTKLNETNEMDCQ